MNVEEVVVYILNCLKDVFYTLIQAHILLILFLLITFIVEKLTGLNLFTNQFKGKKSTKNAEINRDGDSVYYFIFLNGVLVYNIYKNTFSLNILSGALWLIIVIILWLQFRKYYDKYQGVDPDKADDDYTLD